MTETTTNNTTEEISLQQDFYNQLNYFLDDTSEQELYKKYTPLKEEILVKLFKFIPERKTETLGKSRILVKSALNGAWKPSDEVKNEKIFPICKVIKVGKGVKGDIDTGKAYIVPYNDVNGDSWDPDFMFMVQNFAKQGRQGSMTEIPEGMRQKISNLEKNWERYRFSMPDRLGDETEDDRLVYLIPELKLVAEYHV